MNKLESFVYQKVKNNYIIKNALRNIYQGFYDLLPNYDSSFLHEPTVKAGCFFGFHDVTPFSADNRQMLSNRLTIPLRMPTKKDKLEVGVWSGKDYDEWTHIGETTAWNYHKGCRLQWLPGGRCIYNIAENDRLKACIHNMKTGEDTHVDWPIDTASHDGIRATSFSYERLNLMMPGYGYVWGDDDAHLCCNAPEETGLCLVDLENNRRELLLSLRDVAAIQPEDGMDGAFHFVTHTEFSPDDRFISMLHRWYHGTFRRTRMLVYDTVDKQVYVSPTTGMVSHYVWNGEGGIVAYCRVEDVDSHVFFTDHTMKEWKRCGYPRLNSDGHHHFINNRKFVVDTYPDKYRHAKIFSVDVDTDEVKLLVDVKSPKKFVSPNEQKHWRCDLHPRVSPDGTLLSFDSVYNGERNLCVMRL